MSKFIKLFDVDSVYNDYINSTEALRPNVSFVKNEIKVYYNPYIAPTILPNTDTTNYVKHFVIRNPETGNLNYYDQEIKLLYDIFKLHYNGNESDEVIIDITNHTLTVNENEVYDIESEPLFMDYLSNLSIYDEYGSESYNGNITKIKMSGYYIYMVSEIMKHKLTINYYTNDIEWACFYSDITIGPDDEVRYGEINNMP